MIDVPSIQFEIQFKARRGGWLPCALVVAEQRYPLQASEVFPPFQDLATFVQAVAVGRLPHVFYWDEEGRGAWFEAWPDADTNDLVRLCVGHDDPAAVWVDAALQRQAVVDVFLTALQAFRQQRSGVMAEWQLTSEWLDGVERIIAAGLPPRAVEKAIAFDLDRLHEDRVALTTAVGGLALTTWYLLNDDPFWQSWSDLLAAALAGEPLRLVIPNHIAQANVQSLIQSGLLPTDTDVDLYRRSLQIDPLDVTGQVRWRAYTSDRAYPNLLVIDETLAARQLGSEFLRALDAADDIELAFPADDLRRRLAAP